MYIYNHIPSSLKLFSGNVYKNKYKYRIIQFYAYLKYNLYDS